jgi:putative thioredoxin
VTAAKGAVKMVKVNVDENQMIAGQLRIQSIPTVYAFWQGQPVDGFQGAVPPPRSRPSSTAWCRLAGGGRRRAGRGDRGRRGDAGQGAAVDAAQTFAAILGEEPRTPRPMAGWCARISRWTISTRPRRS